VSPRYGVRVGKDETKRGYAQDVPEPFAARVEREPNLPMD